MVLTTVVALTELVDVTGAVTGLVTTVVVPIVGAGEKAVFAAVVVVMLNQVLFTIIVWVFPFGAWFFVVEIDDAVAFAVDTFVPFP